MERTEWYREEYKDRWDELISMREILERTGYTRTAVSRWRSRHEDMPKEVCKKQRNPDGEKRGHGAYDIYYVREEMEPFLEKRLERARVHGPDKEERYQVIKSRVPHDEKRVKWLRDQEESVKQQLEAYRVERERLQDRLNADHRFLAAFERDRK
ncbi:hypothetical protein [Streptomyces rimosus]|uniref:hypothetical protein n=1 Tax=Streptomyces rimosus TaxID=1927 RepID=UPI00131DF7B8|nr:hypothetical protein [Streptomyces rimosus]